MVLVANVHFDWKHSGGREKQARETLKFIKDFGVENMILTGDMNGDTHEAYHKVLRGGGFVSAMKEKHGHEKKTHPSHSPRRTIDFILTKGNLKCEAIQLIGDK